MSEMMQDQEFMDSFSETMTTGSKTPEKQEYTPSDTEIK